MKLIFSSVIVLIFLGLDFSRDGFTKQNEDLSFLIGLMNDYGGKPFLPNHPKEKKFITDFYSGQSESLEQFKLGILKANLKMEDFEFIEGDGDSPITRVYSSKYSKLFNSYYKFKKSDDFYYYDEAFVQDFFQNGIHRHIVKGPYFNTNFGPPTRSFYQLRTNIPWSLY